FDVAANLRNLHSFPTRRSSDLEQTWIPRKRGLILVLLVSIFVVDANAPDFLRLWNWREQCDRGKINMCRRPLDNLLSLEEMILRDRKSTRLNSSHDQISYAVFC